MVRDYRTEFILGGVFCPAIVLWRERNYHPERQGGAL